MIESRPVADLFAALRTSTSDRHAAIERLLNPLESVVDRASLGSLLESMWGFYKPKEESLASLPWNLTEINFDERRKTAWLEADLLELGLAAKTLPQASLRIPSSLEEGIGCLYVLEGATLGGQIILAHLRQKGICDNNTACRFYSGYQERNGERWKEFKAAAASFCRSKSQINQAVAGATSTFDEFLAWFGQTTE